MYSMEIDATFNDCMPVLAFVVLWGVLDDQIVGYLLEIA